jgi:hypothetical protein
MYLRDVDTGTREYKCGDGPRGPASNDDDATNRADPRSLYWAATVGS